MLQPSGCSNDLAAEVVHFSICWTHEEKLFLKTAPNAFESEPGRKRFDLRLENQPFVTFACFC